MPTYLWFDRKFTFDMPIWMYPNIVERVRGTPARVEERAQSVTPDILTARDGERWSIQENVGHLWDLESLFIGRLDDFESGRGELRPADLDNTKTHDANHNQGSIETILEGFRAERQRMVDRLDSYDEAFVMRAALHPRLKQPMRVLDLALFVAEHDDHHMARITEVLRMLSGRS